MFFVTSFETMHLTFNLLEWGSVQINPTSTNFTYFSPLILLKQIESNSLDSSSQDIQAFGGLKYLLYINYCVKVLPSTKFTKINHTFFGYTNSYIFFIC